MIRKKIIPKFLLKRLELLRRVTQVDNPPLSNEELVLIAKELFLELDQQEIGQEAQ